MGEKTWTISRRPPEVGADYICWQATYPDALRALIEAGWGEGWGFCWTSVGDTAHCEGHNFFIPFWGDNRGLVLTPPKEEEEYCECGKDYTGSPHNWFQCANCGKFPAWIDEDIMPCGHPKSAIISSKEGTNYCGECEKEKREDSPEEEKAPCFAPGEQMFGSHVNYLRVLIPREPKGGDADAERQRHGSLSSMWQESL